MNAEKRIECLLNTANSTLKDLPKHGEYRAESINAALTAVDDWAGVQAAGSLVEYAEYICHLADVIDRLEEALTGTLQELREAQSRETATRAERAGVIMDSMMGM